MLGFTFSVLATALFAPNGIVPNPEPRPARSSAPNVLLIVLDDLGTDRLAMYGQASAAEALLMSAPNLDALADAGVRFTNAYASPQCSSSRAMILTGRHAFRTGMYNFIQGGTTENALPDKEVLLPEYLRKSSNWPGGVDPGYAFGAFGKWHLIKNTTPEQTPLDADLCHPIRNGFDRFRGTIGNEPHYGWRKISSDASAPAVCAPPSFSPNTQTWSATDAQVEANAWIDGLPEGTPWFAYVAFGPPHLPLQVPDPFPVPLAGEPNLDQACATIGFIPRRSYTAPPACSTCNPPTPTSAAARQPYRTAQLCMIQHLDAEIGQLIWNRNASGQPIVGDLRDNTYVFVISDNGSIEEFMEIDPSVQPNPNGNAPFPNGHAKRTLYQLGVRVPLIVAGPDVAQDEVCTFVVSAVDLFDTIALRVGALDPAHIQPPETPVAQDSIDFGFLLEDPEPIGPLPAGLREFAFAEWAGPNDPTKVIAAECTNPWSGTNEQYVRMITDGTWKYIRRRISSSAVPIDPPPPPTSFTYCACTPGCGLRRELYNIASDPNELVNVVYDPANSAVLLALSNAMDCYGGPAEFIPCAP